MRSALAIAPALLFALACGGAETALDEGTAATPPSSPAFEVEVVLDASAKAELVAKKERIVVDVSIFDFSDDQGTYVRHEAKLPSEGGVVQVPELELVPGPSGDPLTNVSINVWTARESSERNLLSCDYWGESVDAIPARVTLQCKLI